MSTEIVSIGEDFEIQFMNRQYNGPKSTAFKVSGVDGTVRTSNLKNDGAQTIEVTVSVAVASGKSVTITGALADNTDATKPPVGIVVAGVAANSVATVVTAGRAAGVLSGATPGTRYYLSSTGDLTVTKPVTSTRALVVMGYAETATSLFVAISDQGVVP